MTRKPGISISGITLYPIRFCAGGCANPNHHPHVYSVDPVDGPLSEIHLCPGNSGPLIMIMEELEDGVKTGWGFICQEYPRTQDEQGAVSRAQYELTGLKKHANYPEAVTPAMEKQCNALAAKLNAFLHVS